MYEAVIGLEIHAHISTQTKMFCSCSNDSFGKKPNTNVCPICMGFPGMLPATNKEALKKGLVTALALHCEIPQLAKFDRKNYFYPDLPSGFQISEYDEPISKKGYVDIELDNGEKKCIRITRLHLENDAGKLTHVAGGSLVDFNRAGAPLMEIVTEPDIRSAKEAQTFAKMIQKILRYVGSSEADMEKGMMRFDASVSTRPQGDPKLYPRAEIKNLNSFKSLETAIDYEIARQTALWEKGEPMKVDITVGWVDADQKTQLLRDKEDSADYRYFPEPDLPPLVITPEEVAILKKEVPELPLERRQKFLEVYKLSQSEAEFFSEEPEIANYFQKVVDVSKSPAKAASFLGTVLMGKLKEENKSLRDCRVSAEHLGKLIRLVNENKISNNLAKGEVFAAMFETGEDPEVIVKKKGLKQVENSGEIEALVDQILAKNEKVVNDFKSGTKNAFGFLVGQVMKASQGKANPGMVNEMLKKKLGS